MKLVCRTAYARLVCRTAYARLILCVAALVITTHAFALDSACLPYIETIEKMQAQPRRAQSITSEGVILEFILIGNDYYAKMDEKWRRMPIKFREMERKVTAAVRSGEYALTQCSKLSSTTFDGASVRSMSVVVELIKGQKDQQTIYMGDDGLLIGMKSEAGIMRVRYKDVVAPL